MDYVDEAVHLYGVVDKRRENAIFAFVVLAPLSYSHPPSLRFRGLMGDKLYKVQVVSPVGEAKMMQIAPPEWVIKGTIQATGSWLEQIGLPAPILCPSEALLIELTMIC
jgi:alpha-galactosidase